MPKKKKNIVDPLVMIRFGLQHKDYKGETFFTGTENNYEVNLKCSISQESFMSDLKAYMKKK